MSASNDHGRAKADAAPNALTAEDIGSGATVLPPLAGIIELAVLTGLIVAIDAMLPDVDLADIQPNPFWLPVLLLSLQYGTVSGILAAATALLVTLVSGLPEPGVGENYFNYAMRAFSQPILWFGAAVLLGQFRMRQIQAKRGLTAMVVDLEKQRSALAGYADSLRRRCDMLERDRAGSSEAGGVALLASLVSLGADPARAATDADKGAAPDLGADFARTMAAAFPGSRASVLALTAEGLVPMASTATGGAPGQPVDVRQPLFRALVGEGRQLSVLNRGDEIILAGSGLAAVPIRDAAGDVVGAVRLETSDPASLGPGTLPALSVIAAALAPRVPASRRSAGALASVDAALSATDATSHGDAAAPAPIGASLRRGLQTLSWLKRRRSSEVGDEAGRAANDPLPPQRSKTP